MRLPGASVSLLTLAMTAGCGGAADGSRAASPAAPSAVGRGPSDSASPTAPALTLCRAKLEMGDPQRVIRIADDGTVAGASGVIGVLHADGRFISPAGELLTRISASGVVSQPHGEVGGAQLRIDETGRATSGAKVLTLRDDGRVDGTASGGYRAVVSCKEGRRAAIFVLIVLGA